MSSASRWKRVYLALGANIGDKLANLEQACDMLRAHKDIHLLKTSSLYPTKPMYVSEQDWFYNAACEIETTLSPIELLDQLQAIENSLGRVKLVDKGPRNIDLDILLYEGETVNTERLTIPHKLMHEREFVLRPLADIIPEATIPNLNSSRCIKQYLSALTPSDPPMTPIVPFGPNRFLRPLDPHRHTEVMSIINVTPDSFSDGGTHYTALHSDTNKTLAHLETAIQSRSNQHSDESQALIDTDPYLSRLQQVMTTHLTSGATILDIGGQSSRPNAPSISADEEFSRIRPALLLAPPTSAVSIDTYRAAVFASALSLHPSRALILNDISAGLFEPSILETAAHSHSTVVLMHTRGTPETMSQPPHTDYPAGLVATVAAELRDRVRAAEAAGIPRWRIVLDPGIGFAKTGAQNAELLRDLSLLRAADGLHGLPWLVGSSRKKFIGALLGDGQGGPRAADGRAWGTAATVAAAVQGGADVVRVHDVAEMRDVVAVADGIWRA